MWLMMFVGVQAPYQLMVTKACAGVMPTNLNENASPQRAGGYRGVCQRLMV